MDRKDFILKGGMGLVAVTLFGRNTYAFSPGKQEVASNCVPTTADILGPYYRSGAPFRSNLVVSGEAGTLLTVKGKVLDNDCNPIPGAVVDVWQADDSGAYDNTTSNYLHRGKYQVAADGSYSFSSIHPGAYLNGNKYRPSHIHFRVTAPGFTELITQLYFDGDPYIAADPWASKPEAKVRIVPIVSNVAVFDIGLDGNTITGIKDNSKSSPVKINKNPFQQELSLSSANESIINVELFDTLGHLVVSKYDVNQNTLVLDLSFLGIGIYYARIQTSESIYVHKLLKE